MEVTACSALCCPGMQCRMQTAGSGDSQLGQESRNVYRKAARSLLMFATQIFFFPLVDLFFFGFWIYFF